MSEPNLDNQSDFHQSTANTRRVTNSELQSQVTQLTTLVQQLQSRIQFQQSNSIPQTNNQIGDQDAIQSLQSVLSNLKIDHLKPPPPDMFEGKNVDRFVDRIEIQFNYYKIAESNKIEVAARYFEGASSDWYKYLCSNRDVSQLNWNQFKELLIKQFKATNVQQVVRNKLRSLKQYASVAKYNELFNGLIVQLPTY